MYWILSLIVCHFVYNFLPLHVYGSEGSAHGKWVKVVQPVYLTQGYNDVILVSETVGLQVLSFEKCSVSFDTLELKKLGFENKIDWIYPCSSSLVYKFLWN